MPKTPRRQGTVIQMTPFLLHACVGNPGGGQHDLNPSTYSTAIVDCSTSAPYYLASAVPWLPSPALTLSPIGGCPSMCGLFVSRASCCASMGLFLSFSPCRLTSLAACRASRSCFSFARRRAFDSNSCQSPWMLASLRHFVSDTFTCHSRSYQTYAVACLGGGCSVVKYSCSRTSAAEGRLAGS